MSSREEEMIDRMWGRSPSPGGDSSSLSKTETQLASRRNSKDDDENRAIQETDNNEEDEGEDVDITPFDPENYDAKKFGPILPNGEINWDCPCLGGAAHGPCATEFRGAFSCFHFR